MKRHSKFLIATSMFLGSVSWCEWSQVSSEPDPSGDEQASNTSTTVEPSAAQQAQWEALRQRYQDLIAAKGRADVDRILLAARTAGSATLLRDPEAVTRFFAAAELASQRAMQRALPTLADAVDINALVTGRGGALRTAGMQATCAFDSAVRYTAGARVHGELREAFARLEASRTSGPARAAAFDQELIGIHSFLDGNGRTTRLLTDWLLARDGYPPVIQARTPRARAHSAVAHVERVTDGMRTSVELLEALA
jgi:hypothetical protein